MQRLFSAILAHNEADPSRYLRPVLARCKSFSDAILLLDDRSTDQTPKIAREYGAIVKTRSILKERAWGHEASARKELWEFALEHCTTADDWVLVCDADMELVGDPRELIQTKVCNSIAFVLYDCWSEKEYRADEYWRGHEFPRVWLIAPKRVPTGWQPQWNARGVHPGHLPANWPAVPMFAPPDSYYWKHLGWSKSEHRQQKYLQYMAHAHQLSDAERQHVESILA